MDPFKAAPELIARNAEASLSATADWMAEADAGRKRLPSSVERQFHAPAEPQKKAGCRNCKAKLDTRNQTGFCRACWYAMDRKDRQKALRASGQ